MAFGMNVAAQADFTNKKYTIEVEEGGGGKKTIAFDLLSSFDALTNSEDFIKYKIERKEIVDGVLDELLVEPFLNFTIGMMLFKARTQLVYPETLRFVDAGSDKPLIMISKDFKLMCRIPFAATNKIGEKKFGFIYFSKGEIYTILND